MTATWVDKLRAEAERTSSIVCFGIDPVMDPKKKTMPDTVAVREFYFRILQEIRQTGTRLAAVKPNIGFFEGLDEHDPLCGLGYLRAIRDDYHNAGIPLILDAKRGDIGKTAERYAHSVFNLWHADATTVAPYMGSDSITPFTVYCAPEKGGKGVYVLCMTSNESAGEVQDFGDGHDSLFARVARLIAGNWFVSGIGAVVAATYPAELEEIAGVFKKSGKDIPLLIPGVGRQGGSAAEIADVLRHVGYDLRICRINSSSGIAEAWKKEEQKEGQPVDYAGAAVRAIQKLNEEIGLIQ